MKLLNDRLILKYFNDSCLTHEGIALAILEGMEAPIRKGDRILQIQERGNVVETIACGPEIIGVRTNLIRLPEKFQRRDLEAELEKKVADIIGKMRQEFLSPPLIIQTFEEMIDLARRAEREKIRRLGMQPDMDGHRCVGEPSQGAI